MHVKHTDACVYMCLCMSVDVDIHVCLCVKDAYVWPVAMAPYKHNPGAPLDPSRTCTGTHIYISIHSLFWCCLPLLHLQ